jgi:hypothetical protein
LKGVRLPSIMTGKNISYNERSGPTVDRTIEIDETHRDGRSGE